MFRGSPHHFKISRFQTSVERGLLRAIDAKADEPTLAGSRLDPPASFPLGAVGPKQVQPSPETSPIAGARQPVGAGAQLFAEKLTSHSHPRSTRARESSGATTQSNEGSRFTTTDLLRVQTGS